MPTNQRAQRSSRGLQLSYIINPLNFAYRLDAEGKTRQVYYDNTGTYSPDRRFTPTTLTPVVQAQDPSTLEKYDVVVNSVYWYEVSRNGGTPIRIELSGADYQLIGTTLVIKKNVSPNNPIDIRAEIHFYDPRESGKLYTLYDTVSLNTTKDSDLLQARVNIVNEIAETYDPIIDGDSHLVTFTAEAALSNEDITGNCEFTWYAKDAYTANYQPIDTTVSWTDTTGGGSVSKTRPMFPAYGHTAQQAGKGQGTDVIILDAFYVRGMHVKVKARPLYTPCVSPSGNPSYRHWYERRLSIPSDNIKSKYVYTLTEDTTVDVNKAYYTEAVVVHPEGNPQEQQWYELNSQTGVYELTSDTSVVSGKTYYSAAILPYVDEPVRGFDWVFPNVDAKSVCKNGNKLPVEDTEMFFTALVDTKGGNPRHLDENDLQDKCILKWWEGFNIQSTSVQAGQIPEKPSKFLGFGPALPVSSGELKVAPGNSSISVGNQIDVYYDLFFQENLELWTHNGEPVTYQWEEEVEGQQVTHEELAYAPVVTLS